MSWTLDGVSLGDVRDVTITATSVSVSARVARSAVEPLRDFDQTGNAELVRGAGGQFRTRPRGDQIVTLSPRAELSPPVVDPVEGVVVSFDETQVATDVFDVSVEVQRLEPRSQLVAPVDQVTRTDAQSASDLETVYLATAQSELQLDHVGLTERAGDPADGALSLTAILSDTQAAAIADDARFASAVVSRTIPDAGDELFDTTGGQHTVRLNAPPGAPVDAGEYALREWQLASYAPAEGIRWALSATVTLTEPIATTETLVVEGGEVATVEAHTEEVYNQVDVRDGGSLVVEPDATLRIVSPIDNRS